MKAQLEAASILGALKIAAKLAPNKEQLVVIECKNKKLFLHSFDERNQCSVLIPGKAIGDISFAITSDSLSAAVRNRGQLNIEVKNTVLTITSGKFLVELPTLDSPELEEKSGVEGTKIVLSAEQSAELQAAVKLVALKPNAQLNVVSIPIGLKITKKGSYVACYDSLHTALTKLPSLQGEAEFAVPLHTFQALLEVFAKSKFRLTVNDKYLVATNGIAQVRLGLPEPEDNEITVLDVIKKTREASSIDGASFQLEKEELTNFLSNARSVALKERNEVKVVVGTKQVQLEVSTSNGTVKERLSSKGKQDVRFNIDFEHFEELIGKTQTIDFVVVEQSFIMSISKDLTMLVALNQD